MAQEEEFDPEFKKLLRKLITERLAQEAVSGGSWKNALENLKDIFEIDRAQLEREITSLVVLKSWEEKRGPTDKADEGDKKDTVDKADAADQADKQNRAQEDFEPTGADAKKSSRWGIFQTGGKGPYGEGVRAQVFEVIVRQGVVGAPWREICAAPMKVNNIDPDQVQTEINRRLKLLGREPQKSLDEFEKQILDKVKETESQDKDSRPKDKEEPASDNEDEPPKQGGKGKKKGKK